MADASSGKVPIFDCIQTAWRFFLENWQRFAPAALIVAATAQLGVVFQFLSQNSETSPRSALDAGISDILVSLPALIAGTVFTAAVLRKAVRGEFNGRVGLGFGADELRLFGVLGSLLLLFIPLIALVVGVIWMVVLSKLAATPGELEVLLNDPDAMSEAISRVLGPTGEAAFALFMVMAFGLGLVLMARLFMLNAATIGEKRVVMFQTWSWSRSNVLRMIAAIILVGLPIMIINNMVTSVAMGVLQSMPVGAGAIAVSLTVGALVSFVSAMASIPMVALGAVFYKGLRPPDFVAK